MVLDDIADLMEELCKRETRKTVAGHFTRDRKWAYNMALGCPFRLDTDFIAGLDYYGYELKLVKKERTDGIN